MDEEIMLIDKPAGMSSFGVVARVRRVLSEKAGKKVKVGHTGTLDPFATGLLILLVGKGTKRSEEFLKLDKRYEAVIRLGEVSSTGDVEGEIRSYKEARNSLFRETPLASGTSYAGQPAEPSPSETNLSVSSGIYVAAAKGEKSLSEKTIPSLTSINAALEKFRGEIVQRVPRYSAVKINGQRAYKLAREGKEVEMPTRKVKIYDLEVLEYKWPELKISCHVSSGTYIRTLGEDIGEELGVGGYLTELRRTEVGGYKVQDAKRLEELGVV